MGEYVKEVSGDKGNECERSREREKREVNGEEKKIKERDRGQQIVRGHRRRKGQVL